MSNIKETDLTNKDIYGTDNTAVQVIELVEYTPSVGFEIEESSSESAESSKEGTAEMPF